MAASLSAQIPLLVDASSSACSDYSSAYIRSLLECAYFFGSAVGVFWGPVADRLGRRKIALLGLAGMSACCVSMGFAKSLTAFMALRTVAGAISSAVTVAGLAMLADVTQGSSGRVRAVARLPIIAIIAAGLLALTALLPATAPARDYVILVAGDCGSAATRVMRETGGELLSAQPSSDGQTCIVTVLVQGNGSERPRKVTVRVPM